MQTVASCSELPTRLNSKPLTPFPYRHSIRLTLGSDALAAYQIYLDIFPLLFCIPYYSD